MKTIALFVIACVFAFAQDGALVNQNTLAPSFGVQKLPYYSGSNLIYLCAAKSLQPFPSTIAVSAASAANPVSFTATAHGLGDFVTDGATATPTVCITGYTGNWAAINGCFTATTTSANAFTITVNSSAFGAVTGAGVFTTQAPRWNQAVWSIFHAIYDGSGNMIFQGWAASPAGAASSTEAGGTTASKYKCSSRSSYGYQ